MFSNQKLKAALQENPWTGYNIRLSDEVVTLPGQPEFLWADERLQAIVRTLHGFFGTDLSALRIADLGCLEGGFSLAFAMKGAQVVGFDARKENLAAARLARDHFELSNLQFERIDVKDFTADRYGRFDAILALGILYHLDRPVEWLNQVTQAAARLLIVDTHVAPADDASLSAFEKSLGHLGKLEELTVGGVSYRGRWYEEVSDSHSLDSLKTYRWCAWSNRQSFWLTRASLCLAMKRAGCDLVYEQQDWMTDQWDVYNLGLSRRLMVGAKV
jgi:precorrin-6B methylase 2